MAIRISWQLAWGHFTSKIRHCIICPSFNIMQQNLIKEQPSPSWKLRLAQISPSLFHYNGISQLILIWFWQNFDPKLFWTQNILGNMFLDTNFFWPNIFRTKNFLGLKFVDSKFFGPQFFLDPNFLDPKFVWTLNFFGQRTF